MKCIIALMMLAIPVLARDYPYNKQTTNIASEFIVTKECPLPYGLVTLTITTNITGSVTNISRLNINSRWGDLTIPEEYLKDIPNPRLSRVDVTVYEGTRYRQVGANWISEKIDYGDDVKMSVTIPFTPISTNERPPYVDRTFVISRAILDSVKSCTLSGRVMNATYLLEPK